jgi:AcrR family transcriptional regulator
MRPGGGTREAILEISNRLVQEQGGAGLTFAAVAKRLGTTKQAVIYWFPTKESLIRALALPALNAEAEAMVAAVAGATSAPDAAARFVRAFTAHHLADLRRFRLVYLAAQFNLRRDRPAVHGAIAAEAPPVTGTMYAALEAKFIADPRFPAHLDPRRAAVIVHMAALGLVAMEGLADAVGDPLAHRTADLIETLAGMMEGAVLHVGPTAG